MSDRELRVKLTGDTTGLTAAAARAERDLKKIGSASRDAADDGNTHLGRFGAAADGLGRKLSTLGSVATNALKGLAFGGVAGAVALVPMINQAAELEDTISKVGVVFGEQQGEIDRFARAAATAFGLSRQQAMDAASTFGIMGKGAGLAGRDLAEFSTEMTGLAGDLASFFGGETVDAVEAIGAALRGEAEPIRRYGVMLDDATLRNRALAMGLIKTTKDALTPQQRALAATQEILAQTTDAQGDFSRTSSGASNQLRILKAQFSNVTTELGAKFLPIATRMVTWINSSALPALQRLSAIFDEEGLGGILRRAGDVIKTQTPILASALWEWIVDVTPIVVDKLGEYGSRLGRWLLDTGLPTLRDKLIQWGTALWQWIVDATPGVLQALAGLSQRIGAWFGERAPGWAADAAKFVGELPQKITEAAARVDWSNLLRDAGTKMSQGMLAGFMVGPGAFLLGFGKGIGAIPQGTTLRDAVEGRAAGGPVSARTPYIVGENGPELMVPGSSGTIVPNHQLGGNVTVNVSLLDGRAPIHPELVRSIQDAIWRARRAA